MKLKTPKESLKKVADLVLADVTGHYGDAVAFDEVKVVNYFDEYMDDELLYVYIIYNGKTPKWDIDWNVGIVGRVQSHFTEDELPVTPMRHFIPKSGWKRTYTSNVAPWNPVISST